MEFVGILQRLTEYGTFIWLPVPFSSWRSSECSTETVGFARCLCFVLCRAHHEGANVSCWQPRHERHTMSCNQAPHCTNVTSIPRGALIL
eukprot:3809356-Amphidinium_carterae.1